MEAQNTDQGRTASSGIPIGAPRALTACADAFQVVKARVSSLQIIMDRQDDAAAKQDAALTMLQGTDLYPRLLDIVNSWGAAEISDLEARSQTMDLRRTALGRMTLSERLEATSARPDQNMLAHAAATMKAVIGR